MIECRAHHIYKSASPSLSLVRALPNVDARRKVQKFRYDCIEKIRLHLPVGCMAFSHKEDLISVGKYNVIEILKLQQDKVQAH
jgi:hypothetical protein